MNDIQMRNGRFQNGNIPSTSRVKGTKVVNSTGRGLVSKNDRDVYEWIPE